MCLRKNLSLEVFHPRLMLERACRNGPRKVIEPLFPGYIFVRFNLSKCLQGIRYSTGISSLVHFGERIPSVPDNVIEELQKCFDMDDPMVVEDYLIAGAEVIIAHGPFQGFQAMVIRLMPARQRVQVLVDFLGRMTVAEVDRRSVTVETRRMADMMPELAIGQPISVAAA